MALTKLNKNSSSDGILTDVEINTGTLAGTHILGYDTVSGAWVNANPSAWLIPSASQTVSGMTWSSSSKSLSITHADASFDSLSLTDVAMENSDATFSDLVVSDISVDNGTNLLMRADASLNKVQVFTELQVDGNVTATTFRQANTATNAFSLASSGRITTGESLVVTGDLTVDTDTLVVDSTNDKVGIGITAPQNQLHIASSGSDYATIRLDATSNSTSANWLLRSHDGKFDIRDAINSANRLTIDASGDASFSGTVTASGGNSGNWNTAYGWGDHASAGYLTSASASSFDSLSGKTSGTGTYRTSGDLQSGTSGEGMVALTTNDGGGNANVTFNHANNAPDASGYNTGRITVNVDSTTGAAMTLSAGTGGAAPNSGLTIYENRISAAGRIDLTDTNVQLKQASDQLRVQTANGWGGFGPQNTGFCHITTDRSKFYMSEPLQVDGTISIYNGNLSLGGSGTIGGTTWANGQFHLGTSSSGWAMDPNEFYNSGAGIIGTLTGDLNLNPKSGYITTSRPFVSTSYITADGGGSANWNTAYGWGNHASAGYYKSGNTPYFTNVNLVASNGNGLRFWNSPSYTVYMSATADSTYGGSVLGAGSSDYNMYFKMSGGTNRGFVFKNGSNSVAQIDAAGNIDFAGQLLARCNSGNLGESSNTWPIQVYQPTGGSDAMMSFHVAGDFAFQFGLDGSTNKLSVGGWSLGSNMYPIYHAGNPPEKVTTATAGSAWYDILGHSGGTVYADTACHIHGSGYIQAVHFNNTHGTTTRNADTVFYTGTSDGYLRRNTKAGTKESLNITHIADGAGGGEYGSVHTDGGGTGGYEGFSIGGRMVFMHNNNTVGGIFNDVNNHWFVKCTFNGQTSIHHAGVTKGYTYSSGWRVTGNMLATSNVYAYYSDERLKDVVGAIEEPLESVKAIRTFYYTHNDKARELGYEGSERQVGVSAQSVQAVMPEVIGRAPIDDDGEGGSVTGEDYVTVQYERLVPLLIESIKTLSAQVEGLQEQINAIQ